MRLDSGFGDGDEISVHYDSLIGKLIVGGSDRDDALTRLRAALDLTHVAGIATNLNLLGLAAAELDFKTGRIDTGFIADHPALLQNTRPDMVGWAILALAEQLDLAASRAAQPSPWAASDNWRISGSAPLVWHFEYDGVDHAVSLLARGDHWLVGWRDEAMPLRLVERLEHSFVIELGDQQFHGHVHADGATRWLKVASTRWRVRALGAFGRPPERRDLAGGSGGSVNAPMPGRIVSIQAAIGDTVAEGQVLLRLEAMKMEHNLAAGTAGKIAAILVATGDQVVEGAELIRIEGSA